MRFGIRLLIGVLIMGVWILVSAFIQTTFGISFKSDNVQRLYDGVTLFSGFAVGFLSAYRS